MPAGPRTILGTNPAANTECSDTVPGATNEVQTITGTPSDVFGLSIQGESGPATLAVDATAAAVQAYLRAFSVIGPDGVTCTGGPLASTITCTFAGQLTSGRNMGALTVTGGVTGLTITTTVGGDDGRPWLLYSVSVECAQGATQTPWPSLVIDDGTNVLFRGFSGTAAMSAGTTTQHTWAPGLPAVGSAASVANTGPLPEGLVLPPGYRIRTLTTGIGANTNYGAPVLMVAEV
jgi:hypothetical protein